MVLGFTKTFRNKYGQTKQTKFEDKIKDGRKLHTIRWDEKHRWAKGKKIHFATGVRSSRYNCFKEGICTGTQRIEIKNNLIYIEDRELPMLKDQAEDLSINDGFDSIDDFWEWFDQYQPFTGKIIHWTDIRY